MSDDYKESLIQPRKGIIEDEVEIPDLPPFPDHKGPQDKMSKELQPDKHVKGPTTLGEKPEIDNTHRDAALAALRAGKPLQKGTQPRH